MPYASARTKSGVRISGGPGFWLIAGWFIVPLWIMGLMLKGAILLVAALVRSSSTRQQQQAVHAPSAATPEPAHATAEPQDAIPDWAKPAPAQSRQQDHRALIAVTVIVCAALLVFAIISSSRFR